MCKVRCAECELLKEPTRNFVKTLDTVSTNRKLSAIDSEMSHSIHFLRTRGFTWVKILQKIGWPLALFYGGAAMVSLTAQLN